MKKIISLALLFGLALPLMAQTLSLDKCRELALKNNKQLSVTALQQDMAENARKAARTQYLPKVDILGTYQYTSKEFSLLNSKQKSALSNLGTNAASSLTSSITNLVQQGVLSPETAQTIGALAQKYGGNLTEAGNALGNKIRDDFHTDTKNLWAGTAMLRQPLYMGGAITAANKMADINEEMSRNNAELVRQHTLYDIDQAYWTVVSVKQKQKLAYSYNQLIKKFNSDVHKMIKEGVATYADGLKVDVAENSSEIKITQAEDGVVLSKMLLCQLCGLPLRSDITLEDEDKQTLPLTGDEGIRTDDSLNVDERPELRLLQNTVDLSKQQTKLIRAQYMPHLALTGGYLISNPNVYDGFSRKFSGIWNVGVTFQMPVWNWFECKYKINASKAASNIAQLEYADANEKMQLQLEQSRFKLKEAKKRLAMARNNVKSAEENLRCANLGFKEGVMSTTDVMQAQTAWEQAMSQKIDAEVEVKLAQVNVRKAQGTLTYAY